MVVAVIQKESKDQKLGIGMKSEGSSIKISSISPEGLFAGSELKAGMTLVSINNKKFANNSDAIDFLKAADVGQLIIEATEATAKVVEGPTPPAGVESGGVWGTNQHVGSQTQMYACLGCLCCGPLACCILACPQDERDAYKLGAKVYDAEGKLLGSVPNIQFQAKGPQAQKMQR